MDLGETDIKKRTIRVHLYDPVGNGLVSTHVFSAGDVKIIQPDNTISNITNLPTFVTGAADGSWDIVVATAELAQEGDIRIQIASSSTVAFFEWTEPVRKPVTTRIWDEPRASHTTSGTFGEGTNTLTVAAAAVASVADGVWDEARAGHTTSGSFGEGTNVVSVAAAAAQTIRDSILTYAFRTGRTIKGFFRRADAFVTNTATGLNDPTVTFFQPDGTSVEFTTTLNTGAGARGTPDVTASET